jgi:Fic family protein
LQCIKEIFNMNFCIQEFFNSMRQTGIHVTSTTLGEAFEAFLPEHLPPDSPPLDLERFGAKNRAAELALARLTGVAGLVPSVEWLLYSAIRKEALLTSQIEGTQATLVDLFDDEAGFAVSNRDDVEEVSNYLKAFRLVQNNLRDPNGLPISVRLLCNAHELLMKGVRGASKQPGSLRQSQNWIGGSRPGNAVFVPPPAEQVPQLLSNLEQFIHGDKHTKFPPLVKIALVHAQFETIHPFLDGNGRIGRLLIAALLEHWQLLPEPLMYLSGYLKKYQSIYYQRLSAIRSMGDWEGWIEFFLEGVESAAVQAEQGIVAVASQIANDRRKLLESSRTTPAVYRLFESLPMMPRFNIEQVKQKLDASFPTANSAVSVLEALGIVEEVTGQKKNRTYSYKAYIHLLSQTHEAT